MARLFVGPPAGLAKGPPSPGAAVAWAWAARREGPPAEDGAAAAGLVELAVAWVTLLRVAPIWPGAAQAASGGDDDVEKGVGAQGGVSKTLSF